jgi:hypothetical protein
MGGESAQGGGRREEYKVFPAERSGFVLEPRVIRGWKASRGGGVTKKGRRARSKEDGGRREKRNDGKGGTGESNTS